ncbi:MAG TPA: ABC transporter ATP-binding protein [Candidatus Paceibacterota bacterium]|nr:ABC transporter ATP-binding protein [Candidatus Paceibacterota bacterium]HSA03353.1 ABC transporter ATP-binding protein [Candidatus Paceibacterota bacterium]
MTDDNLLRVINLRSGYGGLQVLDGVSIHVSPGEIVALIGANGAGKSTLLKAIAGLLPVNTGRILFQGKDLSKCRAEDRAAQGLTLVPEGRGLFSGMTIRENLLMGGYARHARQRHLNERVQRVCRLFPVLNERMNERASNLSGGQQQALALARALVGEPLVLLLDEPSTGLAPALVKELFRQIQQLKAARIAVILAEQNVRQALKTADRAYVMKTGKIVLEGPSAVLAGSSEIQKAYLGQ